MEEIVKQAEAAWKAAMTLTNMLKDVPGQGHHYEEARRTANNLASIYLELEANA